MWVIKNTRRELDIFWIGQKINESREEWWEHVPSEWLGPSEKKAVNEAGTGNDLETRTTTTIEVTECSDSKVCIFRLPIKYSSWLLPWWFPRRYTLCFEEHWIMTYNRYGKRTSPCDKANRKWQFVEWKLVCKWLKENFWIWFLWKNS